MLWLRLHFPGSSLSVSKPTAWMKQRAVSVHKRSVADLVNYGLGLSNICQYGILIEHWKGALNSWKWSSCEWFISRNVLSFDGIGWVKILGISENLRANILKICFNNQVARWRNILYKNSHDKFFLKQQLCLFQRAILYTLRGQGGKSELNWPNRRANSMATEGSS